ncbi:MAG: hypothetical protein KGI97_06450, partial [Alphaproteobacteria bacterium]|nr:hypothetical protein [Alphaproteobacteria bacterium]
MAMSAAYDRDSPYSEEEFRPARPSLIWGVFKAAAWGMTRAPAIAFNAFVVVCVLSHTAKLQEASHSLANTGVMNAVNRSVESLES